ncbi:MAG: methyltransferase domain-containing protein [Saprospiraceae bacterium]
MELDQTYWNNRYLDNNSPWDTAAPTPPLKNYIDNLTDKSLRILVPGAGFAHEAMYLFQKGFQNTYVCDWSASVLQSIQERNPEFPKDHLIQGDFFKLDRKFDLVIEQTFFCAIDPELRSAYVQKMHEILEPGGLLVGLLWSENFEKQGPPFGGTKEEYQDLFQPEFEILGMEMAKDSIGPRLGRELFVRFRRV